MKSAASKRYGPTNNTVNEDILINNFSQDEVKATPCYNKVIYHPANVTDTENKNLFKQS